MFKCNNCNTVIRGITRDEQIILEAIKSENIIRDQIKARVMKDCVEAEEYIAKIKKLYNVV